MDVRMVGAVRKANPELGNRLGRERKGGKEDSWDLVLRG